MGKPSKPYIIVIGSSPGGIPGLMEFVAGLPASFPAAILIVQHIPPYGGSNLHHILNRIGPLRAVAAQDGDMVVPGHIYIATADHNH